MDKRAHGNLNENINKATISPHEPMLLVRCIRSAMWYVAWGMLLRCALQISVYETLLGEFREATVAGRVNGTY